MRFTTAAFALSALTMVAAQNATEFTINVTSIDTATRNTWCIAQTNTCDELCADAAVGNSCDLNGSAPGLQYYTQTIDYFVCEEAYSECITEYENDQQEQANCTTSIGDKCGTLDPSEASTSDSSSTTTAASSATAAASGTSGSSASTAAASSTSTAGAAPTNIQFVGTSAAAAALGLLAYML
ncbi:hypothetical protein BD289DRAFT_452069 [Coniella lustricola]|uniref:DUF7707 domain-containing protein n=1 Tax=Coniella lustricola TaxID=2025994 RepID=A0A2T3ACK9_9PEZI|nr:hypothetical protein BD289DRAFT_452069 [Coniella lustricola]